MAEPASKTFKEQMKEISFRASQRRVLDIDLTALEIEAMKIRLLRNRLDFADTDFAVMLREPQEGFIIGSIRL